MLILLQTVYFKQKTQTRVSIEQIQVDPAPFRSVFSVWFLNGKCFCHEYNPGCMMFSQSSDSSLLFTPGWKCGTSSGSTISHSYMVVENVFHKESTHIFHILIIKTFSIQTRFMYKLVHGGYKCYTLNSQLHTFALDGTLKWLNITICRVLVH